MVIKHEGWPKTSRLQSPVVGTEKLDGANCAVIIEEFDSADWNRFDITVRGYDGFDRPKYSVGAQSRNQLVSPDNDFRGFAAWVWENANELIHHLGIGRHFGEWVWKGHQSPSFNLFNTRRWKDVGHPVPGLNTVPVLYEGDYYDGVAEDMCEDLRNNGSRLLNERGEPYAPPEGVCLYFKNNGAIFKYYTGLVKQ